MGCFTGSPSAHLRQGQQPGEFLSAATQFAVTALLRARGMAAMRVR